MHVFYTPDLVGNAYTLNEQESKHCIQVLRLAVGAQVVLVNGTGGYFTAEIVSAGKKRVELNIVTAIFNYKQPAVSLHLAVGPTKNIERFEWFIEKATEIGISTITPLISERSERKVVKTERLMKIVTAAVKQSMQAYHPQVNDAITFNKFLSLQHPSQRFIAHCLDTPKLGLPALLPPGEDCVIMIGPEGDFTKEEVDIALKTGFKPITLGDNRLRTETAALAACFEVNYINR